MLRKKKCGDIKSTGLKARITGKIGALGVDLICDDPIFLSEMIFTMIEDEMDKEIKKIEKNVKKTGKALKQLEKADKKRDPACDYGMKALEKKKKKK